MGINKKWHRLGADTGSAYPSHFSRFKYATRVKIYWIRFLLENERAIPVRITAAASGNPSRWKLSHHVWVLQHAGIGVCIYTRLMPLPWTDRYVQSIISKLSDLPSCYVLHIVLLSKNISPVDSSIVDCVHRIEPTSASKTEGTCMLNMWTDSIWETFPFAGSRHWESKHCSLNIEITPPTSSPLRLQLECSPGTNTK